MSHSTSAISTAALAAALLTVFHKSTQGSGQFFCNRLLLCSNHK
ncbi:MULTISPECIES: hypothetical protein [Bacillus]